MDKSSQIQNIIKMVEQLEKEDYWNHIGYLKRSKQFLDENADNAIRNEYIPRIDKLTQNSYISGCHS